MKNNITTTSILILCIFLFLPGCTEYSEHYRDDSAGLNGGFESAKNGLPVNWLLYTPKTVPNADFKILLDTDKKKEGKQSLKFDVKACTSDGAWRSPGFTDEYFDKKAGSYKLSFWVMNQGAEFTLSAGGVSNQTGSMKTQVTSNEEIDDWKYFEYTVDVAEGEWLRLEFNVLKPGTFWIDALQIE